ncbi:MAG: carbamoyltransferase N-terminal domain-containing protein [Caldilineales bacterium]
MYILGISCFYHDSAAALLADGELVAAAQEERFSRNKNDYRFPTLAVEFCLQQAGITADDLDYVVFYEKPLPKFERILMSTLGTFPRSWKVFREAMVAWFDEKLWVKSILQEKVGVEADKVLFVEHHLSHAASAFFCSPYEEAAVLTIDGVGEWTTTSLGRATGSWSDGSLNRIDLTSEMRFPHSLGLLYSAFTAWLGFQVNEGEYKVMGMAPYGRPLYRDRLDKLVASYPDGSFRLNMDYFSYHYSPERTFNDRFVELWGKPRKHDAEFFCETTGHDLTGREAQAKTNQYYADVAATIQTYTEDTLLRIVNHLHAETGLDRLVMAGGVGLNSVANGRIMRETPFTGVYIQPAAGDAGGALGAALYAYHVLLGQPRRFVMEHAYYGESYGESACRDFLTSNDIPFEYIEDEAALADVVSDALVAGQVIGLFQGRFEWGPRALGNRSILADPRSAEMKEIVNTKIKFREPFRPFAPVVPEERAAEYFDLQRADGQYPPRFMLMVSDVLEHRQAEIPAVSHMGTGRLQTVRREWNARYYDIIRAFGEKTGTPVLMNTSFNLRGEPIVTTPANAFHTFSVSDIDMLVLERFIVRKPSQQD